jgi:hypothetical protein
LQEKLPKALQMNVLRPNAILRGHGARILHHSVAAGVIIFLFEIWFEGFFLVKLSKSTFLEQKMPFGT